jgi:hypothetical protein
MYSGEYNVTHTGQAEKVAGSIPKVAGSIPTVVRLTFQLVRCGYTLSRNFKNIIFA